MQNTAPPLIFDYSRRRAIRQRARQRETDLPFLWTILTEELADRLNCNVRTFDRCLILGPLSHSVDQLIGEKAREVVAIADVNEDHLPQDIGLFDLVIAGGALDSVNDLPGALIQIRRALKPDGLFLGAMFGAGNLASLKRAMMLADGNKVVPHVHPQIELKAASDLLARAGFKLQVADRSNFAVRYGDWRRLVCDLRDAGIGNCLTGSRPYLGRDYPSKLDAAWAALAAKDGKVIECFEFIHLSGWSPSPDQPRPAPRGSGQVSLVNVLDHKGRG